LQLPKIAEGLTTAMYWEYDGRIGRRWNMDPILKIWESPYEVFADAPIWYIDPNGLDWYENNKTHKAKKFKGSGEHKGFTRRGDDSYIFKGGDLENVILFSKRGSIINKPKKPEFDGGGELRDLAIAKMEKNIENINRTLNTRGIYMDHVDVSMLEGRRSLNTGGKNILGAVGTVLDVWDAAVGLHAYATKGGDADIFTSVPVFGGFFGAANDLQDENERIIVKYTLKEGYTNFYQLLTHSVVGKRSGLCGVYVSTDVLKTVFKQGFLDLNLSQIG
jgi:hypothetical protein